MVFGFLLTIFECVLMVLECQHTNSDPWSTNRLFGGPERERGSFGESLIPPSPPPDLLLLLVTRPDQTRSFLNLCPSARHASRFKGDGGYYALLYYTIL